MRCRRIRRFEADGGERVDFGVSRTRTEHAGHHRILQERTRISVDSLREHRLRFVALSGAETPAE